MIRIGPIAFLIPLFAPLLFGQDPAEGAKPTDSPHREQAAAEEISTEDAGNGVEKLAARVRRSAVVITHGDRVGGTAGTGSGFVVAEDGLIATCAHVIGESRPLTVRFDDGTAHPVTEIHAWDAKLDMAVLRIDANGLEPIPLAEADTLVQGAEVVAMGAPHGLEFSVVRGVVSALRELNGESLIQVAIPVEPGNSGGPLLDRAGHVHGLLSMKSAVTENLGFAAPVGGLHRLLAKPNPVPMEKWLTIGRLDPKRWTTMMGALWKQRAGRITAQQPGDGFGGRSLCLSQLKVPEVPYEVAVEVLLDNEAGAAGLVFESDGGDRHYGFYPSGGNLRLTRFDGPNVFAWTILEQIDTAAYRPGDWNRIRIRVDKEKITAWVNGEQVVECQDAVLRGGKVGLAKFRDTVASFRRFRLGADLAVEATPPELLARLDRQIERLKRKPDHPKALSNLADSPDLARSLLKSEADQLRALAARLESQAADLHHRAISKQVAASLEADHGLIRAALLLAKLDNPEVEVGAYLEEIERMAGEVSASLPEQATDEQKIQAVGTYLFRDNGYHGSRSDYYNRSNSYLNEVIDDREGIPITLSLIFVELAGRLGAEMHGLGLPGHFVACYEKDGQRQIIDPFEGGKPMSLADADALLAATGNAAKAAEFPVAQPREIIRRMLYNLKGIAIEEKDFHGALAYVGVLLTLDPQDAQERLSRALLHLQLGEGPQAKPDLEWLMEHKPGDIHLGRIEELYNRL